MPHETPSRAWQIVDTDLFVINRETYLLVSDYYSKFPFVYVIPSPVTSTAVIAKMKSLFAEQGVPQRVISYNGDHFSSDAFRRFADQWCFDHVTSIQHYQSNGFIERHVQTVKHTLKKVGTRSDVQMALLVLRATPIDSHLPSPAELLYGRRVVSNLPVATWNASGKRCEIRARLDQRQATAKERHDARGVTDLAELSRGQHVRTRHPVTHRWERDRVGVKYNWSSTQILQVLVIKYKYKYKYFAFSPIKYSSTSSTDTPSTSTSTSTSVNIGWLIYIREIPGR